MNTIIVTDSGVDVSSDILGKTETVPLTVRFEKREYVDGVTISKHEFYERLAQSKQIPVTSQATPAGFRKVFEKIHDRKEKCVVITLSSKLSGTYQSAYIAAHDYQGEVYVTDSKSATIGAGVLAELAVIMAENGASAEEIQQRIIIERENVRFFAMLDTLEYLKLGGRISKTAAFAGGILSVKPIITLKDGGIAVTGKARGANQGSDLLKKEIERCGGIDFSKPVLFGYTGTDKTGVENFVKSKMDLHGRICGEQRIEAVGSAIGAHAGHGGIAVAFFRKEK